MERRQRTDASLEHLTALAGSIHVDGGETVDEQTRLERSRDSIDADPGTPGVQYYEDHQEYNRGYADGHAKKQSRMLALGLFFGFWLGVVVMVVSSALAVIR